MKINAIITGVTGMVGEGVLLEALLQGLRVLLPKYVSTLKELGLAMINSVIYGYEKPVLEVTDIIELSKR